MGYTKNPKAQSRKGSHLRAGGSRGTLVAAMERRGSLFVFSFGNDVLPLALGAFHGKSHTTAQRENINHQTATAIAAESLLGIGILVLHKANILMKK